MNKDVLLDSIARTAKDLGKHRYAKYYDRMMNNPLGLGPYDQWKAEQYVQLQNIQQELLRNLKKYN